MQICVPCKKEMTCKTNGVIAHYGNGHCYAGDIYECKNCGAECMTTGRSSYQNNHMEETRKKATVLDMNQ